MPDETPDDAFTTATMAFQSDLARARTATWFAHKIGASVLALGAVATICTFVGALNDDLAAGAVAGAVLGMLAFGLIWILAFAPTPDIDDYLDE